MKIEAALKLLKDGYVLRAIKDGNTYIATFKDGIIEIYSNLYHTKITSRDFLDLYKDFSFLPIEDEKNIEAEAKDKDFEYYSHLQAKQ